MGLPGISSARTALSILIVIGALVLLPGCVRAFHSDSEQPSTPDAASDTRVGDLAHPSDGDLGAVDVGAATDMLPAPANVVFYSVGPSIADHKTGAPSVSIAAGLATFSVPQTAVNLGVGDVLDYGTDHKRCYLSAKVSTSRWHCTTATGATPAATTALKVNSITHAFISIERAIAGAKGLLGTSDLVAAGVSLQIPCFGDDGTADTNRVVVAGYVTSPQRRITIYTPTDTATECNQRQRHSGVWDATKYRLEVTNLGFSEGAVTVQVSHTLIDGLQVSASGSSNVDGMQTSKGPVGLYYFSNNIVVGELTSASVNSDGICTHAGAPGQQVFAWNNIIYGFDQGSTQAAGLYNGVNGTTLVAYNNTIVDCRHGVYAKSGVTIAKNNLAQVTKASFVGTFAKASDYNISSDDVAPGAHSKGSIDVLFVNDAKRDYHLHGADAAARGAGMDLSADATLPVLRDIDGALRVAPWDIGADETP